MEPILITQEQYKARCNTLKYEPDWWKRTRTYEVQLQEGRVWETKMCTDYEYADDFKIIATNPYARILKNNVDVTDKYRTAAASVTSPYGSVTPLQGPIPSKKSMSTYLKPAEYKALPLEEKQKLWNDIAMLLEQKAKRAEIFEALNVSEATYDTIRLDIKANEHKSVSSPIEETSIVETQDANRDNTLKQVSGTPFQRPSLLKRR